VFPSIAVTLMKRFRNSHSVISPLPIVYIDEGERPTKPVLTAEEQLIAAVPEGKHKQRRRETNGAQEVQVP